jgi:hypothetical protein
MFVRIVNALLGLYLFVSAFLWGHRSAQLFNLMIVGVLVMAFGLMSILGTHNARKVNFGLGVWLFLSAIVLPHATIGGLANQIVCAVLLAVTSLFPSHVHYQTPHPGT